MKALKYIWILFIMLVAASCFDDDTTQDTVRISEITIDTLKMQKIYNIDQNEHLNISADQLVTQSKAEFPLSYEWQVDYKVYSEDPELEYVGEKIGSFPVRLKVSNEYGSSFYEFTINVNSAYQRGIAILSENREGKAMYSFMRELSDKEVADGKEKKFVTNCLEVNNPDVVFPTHPTDFAVRGNQLYISFIGTPSIYMLNGKEMNVENIVTDPDPDFIPLRMSIPGNAAREAVILNPEGKAYKFATLEGIILPHDKLTSAYSAVIPYDEMYTVAFILWDKQQLSIIDYMNATVIYSSDEQRLDFTGHTPVALFGRDNDNFTMLTRKDGKIMKTSIAYVWTVYNDDYTDSWFGITDNMVPVEGGEVLDLDVPMVSNHKYQCLYYAVGNKIYRWFYSSTSFPTTPWYEIKDLNDCEITSLAVSPDMEQLYVGIQEKGAAEMSGSLYLMNCDNGSIEGRHMHIAYKPLKVMFKKN